MKVLIFGATGMVGQGVLRECLSDPDVELVMTVGRTATGVQSSKLREVVHSDLFHYESIERELAGFEACFFCLGQTSYGMTEQDYERVTYGITMAAAEMLCRVNSSRDESGHDKSGLTFIYVSGAGTDGSERGKSMWARVKGKTENALLRMPFAAAYMFRPGVIEPVLGARSKTRLYRAFYMLGRPLLPLVRWAFPDSVLTTKEIGQAMLGVARESFPKSILETWDIRAVVRGLNAKS
ncbi:MAG: NAD-dependent epimerase/dehydratase family protein [Candidatus Sulfotelmatobacter sp.]